MTEHTSFRMGEWLHTFFFSLLLELSAEAKSFLLVGSITNTQGRAPEWREKWVLHNSDNPMASFFPNDGGWQLETQRG